MRFAALQDRTYNWMLYDLLSEIPAEFAGRILIGLSREEAEHLTNRANWDSVSPGSSQDAGGDGVQMANITSAPSAFSFGRPAP